MHLPPLPHSTPATPAPQPSRQLKQAAQEFEGMLISSLWKELQDDPMTAPDDSDPAGDSIRSLGLQTMSTALAASGGLGWAKMVEKQLAPKQTPEPSAARALKSTSGPADNQIERSSPATRSAGLGLWGPRAGASTSGTRGAAAPGPAPINGGTS